MQVHLMIWTSLKNFKFYISNFVNIF